MLGTELARRLRATRPQDELLLLDMPTALAPPDDLPTDRAARRHPRRGAARAGARQPGGGGRPSRLDRQRRRRARLRRRARVSTSTAAARSSTPAVHTAARRGSCSRARSPCSAASSRSAPVDDDTRQTPPTTYGATKAMLELLFADATRKGFLDARSARPPTVIVRPGAPNAAASSFASADRARAAGRPPDDATGEPRPARGRDRRRHDDRLPRSPARVDGDAHRNRPRPQPPRPRRHVPRAARGRLHALVDPPDPRAASQSRPTPPSRRIVRTWPTDWRSPSGRRPRAAARRGRASIVRAYVTRIGR